MEKRERGERSERGDRGERGERGERPERGGGGGGRSKYRFEFPGDFNFDYKDPVTLNRFVSEGGKITPARISKLSLGQQRRVAAAVKRCRNLGMLPSGTTAYDMADRPEPISPKPFSI